METIISLVASGLGIALVPRFFDKTDREEVVFRELIGAGSPIPYEVALAWRQGNPLPVLRAFVRAPGR
jgi:DNA-binding transcriptional LysR family regulator